MNEILLKKVGLQNPSEMEPLMSQRTRSLPTPVRILLKILGLTAIVFFLMPKAVCFATQNIQFPEEELANESVLPIFDQPVSVKNRSVLTAQRLEVGGGGGYSLSEPFLNPLSVAVMASYHFTEDHAFNLFGLYNLGGLGDNGKKLNPIPGSKDPVTGSVVNANLQYAPQPKYLLLGN